jgi:hypothetical protein
MRNKWIGELSFANFVGGYTMMIDSKEFIERLNGEYIEHHTKVETREYLIQENNLELRDVKGYHGREILELLQNADDAYQKSINENKKPEEDLEVEIRFENNILTVSNTGTYFDEEGIKAILQGNNSSKSGKYIGNKGTGFRSILNWADKIKLYSGPFSLEFSKEIANEEFNKIKDDEQIQKQLKKRHNLYIPILAMPKNIEPISSKFDTTIQVFVNPEKSNDDYGVIKQLENIDLRLLLFLPNINLVSIVANHQGINKSITYSRDIIRREITNKDDDNILASNSEINLQKTEDGLSVDNESFYLFDKVVPTFIKEDDEEKDVRLSIALPKDINSFKSSYLYSFFPILNTESPFNCVMHASYSLGNQRDTINKGDTNKKIVEQQLIFLKEVASKFAKPEFGNYAIELLTPIGFNNYGSWKFRSAFSQFDLEDYFFSLISDARILQTVNGDYVSIKDVPKLFDSCIPSVFIGEEFRDVLHPLDSRLIEQGSKRLITKIAQNENVSLEMDELELEAIVNRLTDSWTIKNQVEVFEWWNSYYKKSLPHLLKNQNEEWLVNGEECYFLVGDIKKDIPSWVKVPSLNEKYQKVLFSSALNREDIIALKKDDNTTDISRLITQSGIYPLINFAYRDSSTIITTVNSSVDSFNKGVDFLKWLWSNYGNKSIDWKPPGTESSPLKYNFPNIINRDIRPATNLYFGEFYGFNLSIRLFSDDFGEFPTLKYLEIKANENGLVSFFEKFGVNKFPKIETKTIFPVHSYQDIYKEDIVKNGSPKRNKNWIREIDFKLPFIDGVEEILKSLGTKDIIEWISRDINLRNILGTDYYISESEITYLGKKQKNTKSYEGRIKNYLLYTFNSTAWIEINEKKYCPNEILNGAFSRNNSKFRDVSSVLEFDDIEKYAKNLQLNYDDVNDILELFSFRKEVTEFSSNKFYDILLKIPTLEFGKSIELSKIIYRIIEKPSFTRVFEDSDNKKRFFKDGKVLVALNGNSQYYLATDSFLPSPRIVSKNVPVIEKGKRTNNENFKRIFGCKEYSSDYVIDKQSIIISNANTKFQEYFNIFIKYARAYNEDNSNLATTSGRLKITLVEKINIIQNNDSVQLTDDYLSLRDTQTNWYIIVKEDVFDINFLSEQIENIYSNLANTPGFESGKIGELFRAKDIQDREFLIKKEFGRLDVIEDELYANQIKNNFIDTMQKINPNFVLEDTYIDFDDFYDIDNGELIIKTMKNFRIELKDLKNNGFVYSIDLIPYYQRKLKQLIRDNLSSYKNHKYRLAFDNQTLQESFLDDIEKFRNYELDEYQNKVSFDEELLVRLVERFGNWIDRDSNTAIDAEKEYSKNYEVLNPGNQFVDEISNNKIARQFIFFNRKEEFENWCSENKEKERLVVSNIGTVYAPFRGVIPKESKIEYSDSKKTRKNKSSTHSGSYTETSSRNKEKVLKEFGNKGELLVYSKLCDEYGIENVFPRSEAFVTLGILKGGQSISADYDISYKDSKGDEYYIEVKSSSNGKSFKISPGELNFAKENSKYFNVYLVSINNEKPEDSTVTPLPTKFWDKKEFRLTEIIETIEVEF